MEQFFQRLRRFRETLGITQAEMANKLGLTRSGYAEYEDKQKIPKTRKVKDRFYAAFPDRKVAIDSLFASVNKQNNNENLYQTKLTEVISIMKDEYSVLVELRGEVRSLKHTVDLLNKRQEFWDNEMREEIKKFSEIIEKHFGENL